MISLFIRQISNLSTISICLPRNGAHDESRCLAKADCYMLWSGSLVGETKYKLCACPCHEPFQAVPLSNPFQSACPPAYFALTLGCVQGLHKGPINFCTKNDHQNHHRAWLSQTDTGRLSSASIDEVTLTNYVGGHLMDRLSMCKQPCHLNNHFKRAKTHNWFRSGRLEKKYINDIYIYILYIYI